MIARPIGNIIAAVAVFEIQRETKPVARSRPSRRRLGSVPTAPMMASAIRRWAARPRVWYVVAVGNGGAMTLYLWHIPAIAVAAFSLHAIGLDAYDVDAPGFWGLLALRAVVFAVVMAVAFRLLSPLEHRRLPWWDAPARATGARSTAAGVLVCLAGVALVLLAKERADRILGVRDPGILPCRGCGRAAEHRFGHPVFRRRDW